MLTSLIISLITRVWDAQVNDNSDVAHATYDKAYNTIT